MATQEDRPFSYGPLELTRAQPTSGYNIDHNRVRLGTASQAFREASTAVREWKMFDIGWVRLYPESSAIESGATVAVVVRHLGFWSISACRIVYVVEESGLQHRYGFAYGTLPEHPERGEERFTVEWNTGDDSVWYEILAISKPGPMAMLAYPYVRALQRRFARDSMKAMIRAVSKLVASDFPKEN
ncbi:MAG: DUF1990 domain-containing protein [Acidobacteriota bacterium]